MYNTLSCCLQEVHLSFLSHHPTTHKASVVCTRFHRARTIPSTGQERRKEELRVIKALRLNGYKRGFIRRFSQRPPTPTSNQLKATIVIPYIHGVSESIKQALFNHDIRVCMKPCRTLRQILVHPKDPIPMDQRSGVVYEILCGACQQVYMGQTNRNFACRLKEHRRAFKNIDEIRSAVAEHAFNTSHSIDRGNARVIDMCLHHHTHLLLESRHITSKKNPGNRERGPLSILCDSLHGQ